MEFLAVFTGALAGVVVCYFVKAWAIWICEKDAQKVERQLDEVM